MDTEQREEIESAIKALENSRYVGLASDMTPWAARTLIQFARQQLNLRVDGQKFMERFIDSNLISPQCAENDSHGIVVVWSSCAPEQFEALVLECLTTTPEEKE